VPFLLRTGKQLARSEQRVSLVFRKPDGPLHDKVALLDNVLSISLSGTGAIKLGMIVKQPGPALALSDATSRVELSSVDGADPLPPYVRLVSDVITGDRTLFTRPDGLAHAWDSITPLLEHPPAVASYPRGSWGPDAARTLADPEGWFLEHEDADSSDADSS
jgi:glucose-6-phosphate 1-dehydrogenase